MLTLSIYFDASSISIKQFDLLRTSAVVLREVATSDSFVVRNKTTRGNDFTKNNKLVGCWRFHLEVDVSEALRDDMRARNPRILSSRTAAVLGRCAPCCAVCCVCRTAQYSTQLCPWAALCPAVLCCAVLCCSPLLFCVLFRTAQYSTRNCKTPKFGSRFFRGSIDSDFRLIWVTGHRWFSWISNETENGRFRIVPGRIYRHKTENIEVELRTNADM